MLDRIAESLIGKDAGRVVPRRTSATDLAVSAIFVGWLVAIRPPHEIAFLRSGPGWETYYLPLILVVAARRDPADRQPGPADVGAAAERRADRFGPRDPRCSSSPSLRLGDWVVLANPAGAASG